jgi:hypothetical protein
MWQGWRLHAAGLASSMSTYRCLICAESLRRPVGNYPHSVDTRDVVGTFSSERIDQIDGLQRVHLFQPGRRAGVVL